MRCATLLSVVAGVSLSFLPAWAATSADGRYLPSSREFSIDMQAPADRSFHVDRERSTDEYVLVDFLFTPDSSIHGMFAQRTIEWIKFGKPIDRTPFDTAANDIVNGYLENRFPSGKFEVTDRQKARMESGQRYYIFVAKGTANQVAATWQGVILFFDGGIALVSEVHTLNGGPLLESAGVTDSELVSWATTIRPEK